MLTLSVVYRKHSPVLFGHALMLCNQEVFVCSHNHATVCNCKAGSGTFKACDGRLRYGDTGAILIAFFLEWAMLTCNKRQL